VAQVAVCSEINTNQIKTVRVQHTVVECLAVCLTLIKTRVVFLDFLSF